MIQTMRRPSVQHPIRSFPARAVALLSLGGYLLVAIAAPVWHLSGAACSEECAEAAHSAQAHDCHHHCTKTDDAREEHRDGAPAHHEKDCSVCHVLAAKLLTPTVVSIAEASQPVVEVLPSATPRLEPPSLAVVHSRGPPRHA